MILINRLAYRKWLLMTILFGPCLLSAQNLLDNSRTIVVATYQYGDNPRINNIEPFSIYLGQVSGIKTMVKSYASVQLLLQAMNNREVDVAFINTFGYLMLKEQTSSFEISATLHLPEESASIYKSVIVSPRENNLQSLADGIAHAADNTLILVSPGSTSGNLVPRLKLASMMKVDPEVIFRELQYAERHQLALQNVLNETSALAAFGSEEYYKLGPDTVKVDKLWESEPIPLGPVVCRSELPDAFKKTLGRTLLDLHRQNPNALESIKAGWTEAKPADKYMPADDTYYESLINLAGNHDRAFQIIRKFAK